MAIRESTAKKMQMVADSKLKNPTWSLDQHCKAAKLATSTYQRNKASQKPRKVTYQNVSAPAASAPLQRQRSDQAVVIIASHGQIADIIAGVFQ